MRSTVGIGLRREFLAQVLHQRPACGFWEIAPENWMTRGQQGYRELDKIAADYALTAHGLSLSIGSCDPLDREFVQQLKRFLDRYDIELYSEHLSYCSDQGHLYDLLPIPFTEEAVHGVAHRIKQVQELIERPLVLENVSYYAAAASDLSELEFIQAIVAESGCKLLLDVNNVYVNSINHGYDPYLFIRGLPSAAIVYGHIAGHSEEATDLLIDTHGSAVRPEVFQLLDFSYQHHGIFPTLLERDFNIPSLAELFQEATQIEAYQEANNGG